MPFSYKNIKITIPVHYDAGIVGSEADAQAFKEGLEGEWQVEVLTSEK